MKLYLVQHGNANLPEVDPKKNLSEKGKTDVEKVGTFLKNAMIKVPEIFHSPKARAIQTADILSRYISPQEVVQIDGIAPMDPINTLKSEIEKKNSDLMVIGHMPYLDKLASSLLKGIEEPGNINFQQGGVLALEKIEGIWKVDFMIIPDLLP